MSIGRELCVIIPTNNLRIWHFSKLPQVLLEFLHNISVDLQQQQSRNLALPSYHKVTFGGILITIASFRSLVCWDGPNQEFPFMKLPETDLFGGMLITIVPLQVGLGFPRNYQWICMATNLSSYHKVTFGGILIKIASFKLCRNFCIILNGSASLPSLGIWLHQTTTNTILFIFQHKN